MPTSPDPASFHSSTGDPDFDSSVSNGLPSSQLVGVAMNGVRVIRHHGVASGTQLAQSAGCFEADLLTMTMTNGGHIVRRCDGRTIRRPQKRGDIGFLPSGLSAQMEFPSSYSAFAVLLPHGLLRSKLDPAQSTVFAPLHYESDARLAHLVEIVAAEAAMPSFASDLLLDGVLHAIAALLANRSAVADDHAIERIHLSPVRLARVVDYVEAHLHSQITLTDLAEVAQLSPFHFSRVFKRATGDAPYRFVCQRRLDRAAQLLLEGEMALAELALSCGFSSQAHFTAAFTKHKGVSPGRFRRAFSADDGAAIPR